MNKMWQKSRWIPIVAIIFLSSCATQAPVTQLQLPPPLVLQKLPEGDLDCVSDKTYEYLVYRDKMLRERIQTLRNIIKSTQK